MQKTNRRNRSQMTRAKAGTKPRTPTAINQKPIQIPGPIPRSQGQDALKAWFVEVWQYAKDMVRARRGDEFIMWIEKQD